MAKTPQAAGGSRFAHLAGLSAAKKVEEDDKEKDAKSAAEDKDEDEEDEEDDKKDAKADDGDDDSKAAEDDGDEPDEDDKKKDGKKSKSEASIRSAERARCAAILSHPSAAANPALAAELATGTDLPVKAAVALLKAGTVAVPRVVVANDRAARNPNLGADGSPSQSSTQAIAAGWDSAMKRVNGRK
jgi:hypothetical protein